MDINKVVAISTTMLSFITFLGILFALLYYFYQFRNLRFLHVTLIGELYIAINLTFLYLLKGWIK